MLTRLRVKNFKAWKDSGDIRLAPLTVLFGTNSAGKSSLGHLLLGLKQTAASSDRRRALHTGDEASLIDLGTFIECLHGHDREAELEFSLEWTLEAPLTIENPFDEARAFTGTRLSLTTSLFASESEQPVIRRLRYQLHEEAAAGEKPALDVTLEQGRDGKVQLLAKPYRLVRAEGRRWPLEPPEKFHRISDRSMALYKNAAFLADFALATEQVLAALCYLGPLREHPRRTYGWSGNIPESVGPKGEYAIACILAAEGEHRKLNRGHRQKTQPFAEFIASWLVDLGVIESFKVRRTAPGRKDYEVLVRTLGGLPDVSLPDVGFGVSQVLPALVQAFYCRPGSIVWMEQPEIHLHPQVQAHLADALLSAVKSHEQGRPRNVQLIVETHSEHLLTRLQRRIAEGEMTPGDVAIYFCKPGPGGAELEEMQLNEYGEIANWPEDFFGDEMGDLVARTNAAAKRRETKGPM